MSINKKYVMTGMLATALVAPMADVTNSYADDTRTITGRVNFRTGPGKEYDSIGKIQKGETVTYLGSKGSWRQIKYNSKTGYIHKDYISSASTTSTSVKYVNTSYGLNVRKGPSTSYSVITTLANGTKVNVITTSGGWSKITSGSITGYVSNQYLSSSQGSDNTSDNDSNETSTTKYVESNISLNVRKGPGTNYSVVYISSASTTSTSVKYVNTSYGLNVRKGPSTSYSVVTTLSDGTKVTVKSTEDGWSKITTGNTTGYVSSKYLTSSKPSADNDSNETSTTKYVESNISLNVRKGPGTNYSVLTTLSGGTKVTVKSTEDGWSKITTGNTTGYVSSKYLTSKIN